MNDAPFLSEELHGVRATDFSVGSVVVPAVATVASPWKVVVATSMLSAATSWAIESATGWAIESVARKVRRHR